MLFILLKIYNQYKKTKTKPTYHISLVLNVDHWKERGIWCYSRSVRSGNSMASDNELGI